MAETSTDSYWEGKTVLVTGAGGFIGSHLTETLVRLGADTRAMVRYNSRGQRGWLDTSLERDRIEFVSGDIRDPFFVENSMEGVQTVFHLAALIGIPYSYVAPEAYVATNVTGTLNVLQAARKLGTERVVHTSTSEVYGTAREVPIAETHPLCGQSPYSASKIGADKLAESYFLSFDLPVVTARPFNTFGPRQSARAVIPAIISQLQEKPRIQLGATSPTRDLNYVTNTVMGFLAAARSQKALGEVVNFGSGREISIGDLAELIASIMKVEIEIDTAEERIRPEKSEVQRLLADHSKASRLLNWQPDVSLEQGLEVTVNWLADNRDWYRADEYAR